VAFDAVAGREEGVEALNEGGVVAEEGGDAVDHTGSVDAVGPSGLVNVGRGRRRQRKRYFCVLKSFMMLFCEGEEKTG
jgi:hypothetical protein